MSNALSEDCTPDTEPQLSLYAGPQDELPRCGSLRWELWSEMARVVRLSNDPDQALENLHEADRELDRMTRHYTEAAERDEVVGWMRTRMSHAFTQIRNDGSNWQKELKSLELAAYGTLMSGETD